MKALHFVILLSTFLLLSCSKKTGDTTTPQIEPNFINSLVQVNGSSYNGTVLNTNTINPVIKVSFNNALKQSTLSAGVLYNEANGSTVQFNITYENRDSSIVLRPTSSLKGLTAYNLIVSTSLQSVNNKNLQNPLTVSFNTGIDSTDKFPRISDDALMDKVQQQTFKYFWDFGHPVSGLARERNSSGDIVTSGGSGFGIMAIVTAINRNFITRAEGLARMQKITGFLKNNAQKFHGAFPHWLNGATGVVVPFSAKDNGADLVETSFLMQGLLTARQYFNSADAAETTLRNDINQLWKGVEWDWFRQGNQQVLYWHWSPTFSWEINLKVQGWNEALITYVLAAASTTHTIPKTVYDAGWASNGTLKNNNIYYGISLPMGPVLGGPLFFEHYSFLGINPTGLTDQYANYKTQAVNHTKINYAYVVVNPLQHFGYSSQVWGLTASDIPNGYTASSPTNDVGVIAPTAALSSMPYTPKESMDALRFFYYKLGDKIFKEYGFVDAFKLSDPWFANSFLAIDQGPIIIMIENHRSNLLWNLFTSCPEVKDGLIKLGFTAPYL